MPVLQEVQIEWVRLIGMDLVAFPCSAVDHVLVIDLRRCVILWHLFFEDVGLKSRCVFTWIGMAP